MAGAGSMPDPSAEPEYPWIWFGETMLYSPNANFADPMINQRLEIDSKAMRKFKPGQALTIIAQYVNLVGTPGVRVDTHPCGERSDRGKFYGLCIGIDHVHDSGYDFKDTWIYPVCPY